MLPISIEEKGSIWQEHITAIEQAVTLNELLEATRQLRCSLTI
jgi:hypothetical protein